ncbi:MAG: hypothetical protein VXX85_00450, partial [Candidatus Margulisiibacteriota bacterium]|nr:hypothetical protein [Candidatus Margulisiibacteriota bacterium]
TDSDWLSLSNLYDIPAHLNQILTSGQLFMTTGSDSIQSSEFAVLMHVQESNQDMARGGVLLQRASNEFGWEPVLVNFRQQSFLIELKGVGSPIGGYRSYHERTQAGTTKTHTRLTGGLLRDSMENEFKNLMSVQSSYDFSLPGILPLACIGFDYMADGIQLELGMLMRLTRSNIRYSYDTFGSFSVNRTPKALYTSFSNQNKHLLSIGLRHQNLTANNLVYYDSETYVVTDYEELTSIYQSPTSLDFSSDSEPLFLKIFPYRTFYGHLYNTKSSAHFFDDALAMNEVKSGFKSSHGILKDYYHSTKNFLLPDYFDLSTCDWVDTRLKPSLKLQKEILTKWLLNSNKKSFNEFFKPYVSQLGVSERAFSLNSHEQFSYRAKLSMFFIFPIEVPDFIIKKRIKHIEMVLRQIDVYLRHVDQPIKCSYLTPYLHTSKMIDYWDLPLLMFPFLQWVSHWYDFLKNHYSNYTDVNGLINRLHDDLNDPKQLLSVFKQSDDEFIKYLTEIY